MATKISSLLVGMQFDGADVAAGMADTAAAAESMAESVKTSADVIESATAGLFGRGLETAKNFAAGLISIGTAAATVALSGETMAAKISVAVGSWEKGSTVFESLRDVSVKTGVGVGSLTESVVDLVAAGYSAERALTLVGKAAKLDNLAGGGGKGVAAITTALSTLKDAGTATAATFAKLKDQGFDASKALAEELSAATSKKFSPADAMAAVDRGAVFGFTGKNAIEKMLADPGALAAAEKLGDTVAGRLDKMRNTWLEVIRDAGEILIKALPIHDFAAMLEGGAEGIRGVTAALARELGGLVDPSGANSIQSAFEFGKTMAEEISWTLLEAAAGMVDAFGEMQKIQMTIEGNKGWWHPQTMAWDFITRGNSDDARRRAGLLDERDAMGDKGDTLRAQLERMKGGFSFAGGNGDFGPGTFANQAQADAAKEAAASLSAFAKTAREATETDVSKFLGRLADIGLRLDQAKGQGVAGLEAFRDISNFLNKTVDDFAGKFATNAEKTVDVFNGIEKDWAAVRAAKLPGAMENTILDTFRRQRETSLRAYEDATLGDVERLTRAQDDLAKELETFAGIADPAARDRLSKAAFAKAADLINGFEAGFLSPFEKYFSERGKIEKELDSARALADGETKDRILEVLRRKGETNKELLEASTRTEFEKLTDQADKARAAFNLAQGKGDQGAMDVANRQIGMLGLLLANKGRIGDSFFAARADRGSVEEYQARMRDRFGDAGRSIEDLVEAGNKEAKAQNDKQIELLAKIAAMGPKILPGKVVLGRN